MVQLSRGKCQGTGTKEFGSPPMNIVDIQHRTSFVGAAHAGQYTNEYRVVVEYTCSFYSYYDLITSLSADILSKAGNIDDRQDRQGSMRIPIKEGQVIGRIGGQTLDFAVWNNDVTLQRTGKIDYDIDGKLVGTWFREGTGGYDYAQNHRDSFWTSQLSIVYDHLDPTQIRFSIGDYSGKPAQFGVTGNTPDPSLIDKSSGLVKYELVQYNYYGSDGSPWDRFSAVKNIQAKNQTQVMGVALVQMLEDRKIKFEVFLGKRADQVSGFSDKAIMYER